MTVQSSTSKTGLPWQRTLYIMFIAQMFTAVGFSSMFPFLPLYVEELGTTTGLSVEFLAGAVFSAQAFSMMFASPIWGAIADRYGRKLMVERAMFGGAAILLLMAFARSAEELVLLRTIQGLITGTVAAANALIASMAPRRRMGYAMGLLQVGLGTGVALGPLIGGLIADAYGYNTTFYVTAALLFGSGLLVLFGVHEDFTPPKGNSRHPVFTREWRQILSSLVICFFARGIYQPDLVSRALSFAGFDLHSEDLNRTGDQIYREKYRFKMLTGFSLDDLRIPGRIFDTPSPIADLKEGYIQKAIAYAKKVIESGQDR